MALLGGGFLRTLEATDVVSKMSFHIYTESEDEPRLESFTFTRLITWLLLITLNYLQVDQMDHDAASPFPLPGNNGVMAFCIYSPFIREQVCAFKNTNPTSFLVVNKNTINKYVARVPGLQAEC